MTDRSRCGSHIIVGDGITALAFLEQCVGRGYAEITLIGTTVSQFGRGAAYAKGEAGTPWRFAYLLNSPADDIDPAFAKWLAERWSYVADTMANRSPDWLGAAQPLVASGDLYGVNAPREFYGDFMEEQGDAIMASLQAEGTRVIRIEDTARSVDVHPNGLTVHTAGGKTVLAQSLDVATGGPSTMRIEGDDTAFAAPSVFGHEHKIAEHIQRGAEIFCIGGNAAMLDVLRLCQSLLPESALRFTACAPDGEIPAALVPRLPRKLTEPKLSRGHTTAATFLEEVQSALAAAKAEGDEMREIRAGFRAHFLENPLHTYLSDRIEAKRVAGRLRFWLRGGTRDTILDMHRLVGEARVTMVKGLVKSIESTEKGARVTYRTDQGQDVQCETGFVVNCAGAGRNSVFDPLTEDLLRQSLISRCDVSRGLMVGPGCQTQAASIRYLSPAVSQIGDEVMAMPLYDAHMLRSYVARARTEMTPVRDVAV